VAGALGRLITTTLSMLSIYLGFFLISWLNWAILDWMIVFHEGSDE
jgi:hypothetical protein